LLAHNSGSIKLARARTHQRLLIKQEGRKTAIKAAARRGARDVEFMQVSSPKAHDERAQEKQKHLGELIALTSR